VSRIFISHSSENNAQALVLARWLAQEGWDDIFLDLDPERGLKAGERWEEALRDAADRCEAVIFLVSRAWLGSEWCRDEFRLSRHLRKRLFGVLIEDVPTSDLPMMLTREWQVVSIAPAGNAKTFSVSAPGSSGPVEVAFSDEGLRRLGLGLFSAGLDARFFAWPKMLASSSAAMGRSSRRSAACARTRRRGSLSSWARPAPASPRSCAPACFRGSNATTAIFCRCQ
jgi:hypothetical protein